MVAVEISSQWENVILCKRQFYNYQQSSMTDINRYEKGLRYDITLTVIILQL